MCKTRYPYGGDPRVAELPNLTRTNGISLRPNGRVGVRRDLPTRREFLGVAQPQIGADEMAGIAEAVGSGWLIAGPKVAELERDLSEYLQAPYVRCLGSCTAGLTLAMRLAGIGRGDEVLLPAITFVACANVIEHAGATPVFIDSDPETGLVDLDQLEARIGPRTRAVVPVHFGGRPLDMDRVNAIRDRHGVAVIEDAAHAIGAAWNGVHVGAHGNLCSFSFHATKNMTTFEGGALVVNDPASAERSRRLAVQGLDRSAWNRHGARDADRYDVEEPGFKLTMTDVGAAVGVRQLRRLDEWIEFRAALSARYDELLADIDVETLPPAPPEARHAHHLYVVKVPERAPRSRDRIIEQLRARNVGATVHFRGIHLYRFYRDRYHLDPAALPTATDWSERALTVPLHPGMTFDDVEFVVDALRGALSGR
jgi:dTDP-4-amino-4,6-dideoxygalactose transaminase